MKPTTQLGSDVRRWLERHESEVVLFSDLTRAAWGVAFEFMGHAVETSCVKFSRRCKPRASSPSHPRRDELDGPAY